MVLLVQRGSQVLLLLGSGRVGSKQLRDIPPARKYLAVFVAVWCGLAIGSLGFREGWGFGPGVWGMPRVLNPRCF
jgi:hypothetical protein